MKTKLLQIQNTLKAPKGQYNKHGGFNYRSAEDILEAVKPLCAANGCILTISDSIEQVGDRFYVKATATLTDCETDASISVTAFAREALERKGMDSSQLTGACSSYARKYALNGLFCIDDTRDADTNEYIAQANSVAREFLDTPEPSLTYREKVIILGEEKGMTPNDLAKQFGLNRETTEARYKEVLTELERM